MRLIIGIVVFAIALSAAATKLDRASLNDLYAAADVVAVVQIVEGTVLERSGMECGARYRARVIDTIKGEVATTPIEFGHSSGYQIGTYYLVFLASRPNGFNPLLSTNSIAIQAQRELEANCSTTWPSLYLMHSGNSALRIVWYGELSSSSIYLDPELIAIPESGYDRASGAHGYRKHDRLFYVPLNHVLPYLRALGKQK